MIPPKAVYLETMGNPNSDIPDIDAIAAIAHKQVVAAEIGRASCRERVYLCV